MKATADEYGQWCNNCRRPVRKSRDCPDVPLECQRCGPIREVSSR